MSSCCLYLSRVKFIQTLDRRMFIYLSRVKFIHQATLRSSPAA
nr:MAG TPA: hypothetical protein [Caudoviricetes sp.]